MFDPIRFRHDLHRRPELSGQEEETAASVARALAGMGIGRVVTGLGGHGVAAVIKGAAPGPTVMLRAELDALPIPEMSGAVHASQIAGRGHLCGHDGHCAILLAVAQDLSRRPPEQGRVVLMFQPAEEDGSGAAAVLADPAFAPLRPDWAFALHNMPGLPLGEARISAGAANCASVGVRLRFLGRTAHAATPGTGLSPLPALMDLLPRVQALSQDAVPGPGFRLVTVTHARLGAPSFGIAPGEAELWLTLRCLNDAPMAELKEAVAGLARRAADAGGLDLAMSWHEDFAACTNDPQATARIEAALAATGTRSGPAEPMRASEDFGRFGQAGTRSAMFLLGAGEDHPALHDPRYDFPDTLIPKAQAIFMAILHDLLG